ncbi:hypothetical protein KKG58_04200 [Patescibacteria group bacterium]|nr:hypothetical protein [Patescibacteria group bacterium]
MIRALKKLGISVKEGKNHTLGTCVHNGRKTTVPRPHKTDIVPEIVKSIIDFLLEKEFEEKKIIKLLK